MQKSSKAGIVASAVLLLACVAVVAFAVVMGGGIGGEPLVDAAAYGDGPAQLLGSYTASYVDIDLTSASLVIRPSDDGQVHVYQAGDTDIRCEMDSYGALRVTQRRLISFFWESTGPVTVTVLIPPLESLYANCTSGTLTASDVTVTDVQLTSTSGAVGASNLDVPGALYLGSTSGAINLQRAYAEHLSAYSTSGSIKIRECYSGYITVDATSGPISLWLETSAWLYANTTSGAVRLECKEPVSGYVNTTSGAIDITTAPEGQTIILGNDRITPNVSRQGEVVRENDQVFYQFGAATESLWLDTVSGSLTLQ